MKTSIIHLSDFHYKQLRHEEHPPILKALQQDLKKEISTNPNAYLAFSGDHVYDGSQQSQYDELYSLLDPILTDCGIPKSRRISIPGNHDIAQSAVKKLGKIFTGSLGALTCEAEFNDAVPSLSTMAFNEMFTTYKSYEAKFAEYGALATSVSGSGWDLNDSVGIYCLNTAICSVAATISEGNLRSPDYGRLMVDTRSLYRWLSGSKHRVKILIMHHPIDWLTEWAKLELEAIIASSFNAVLFGHIHKGDSKFISPGPGGSTYFSSPPLFTHKGDRLGYSIITTDPDDLSTEITYREFAKGVFTTGATLSGTPSGKRNFPHTPSQNLNGTTLTTPSNAATTDLIQQEFEVATTCYSSKKCIWISRQLARTPETDSSPGEEVFSEESLVTNFRDCLIRAPKQFGLTCLGKYIAKECINKKPQQTILTITLNDLEIGGNRIKKHLERRTRDLSCSLDIVGGIVVDNWQRNKHGVAAYLEIKELLPGKPILLLENLDESSHLENVVSDDKLPPVENLYLWALSRTKIRELVSRYLVSTPSLDDSLVTAKILNDVDALNMHRTPLNCLLILKLTEQAFDDSPVNRTEMIGRVLYLLFYQFDKIPRYATRPDLKDCEYALGYFSEWLIRENRGEFTKNEFYTKVQEYCSMKRMDLDIEVLFSFLATENIFCKKHTTFAFRFSYWLYFFAAHRMHHSPEFTEFIFSNRQYARFPEVMEFYAGIDRRRVDAVQKLLSDLRAMTSAFITRTLIPTDLNPFKHARWTPSTESVQKILTEVTESTAESTLPPAVKDAIADTTYDRSLPYKQDLQKFIQQSSLLELVLAMRGAARVLRNSDHVDPGIKDQLLHEVVQCWIHVCQTVVLISPLLARDRTANFEGMGFYLDNTFDHFKTSEERLHGIMSALVDNVVRWYEGDISSRKMGALFSSYIRKDRSNLGALFVMLIMIRQKSPGWETETEQYILQEDKNSFYLRSIFVALRSEYRIGFHTERTKQLLRRLTGLAIAKHGGAKKPNNRLIEESAKANLDTPPSQPKERPELRDHGTIQQ